MKLRELVYFVVKGNLVRFKEDFLNFGCLFWVLEVGFGLKVVGFGRILRFFIDWGFDCVFFIGL